jgi:hypothetical protein
MYISYVILWYDELILYICGEKVSNRRKNNKLLILFALEKKLINLVY